MCVCMKHLNLNCKRNFDGRLRGQLGVNSTEFLKLPNPRSTDESLRPTYPRTMISDGSTLETGHNQTMAAN